MNSAFEFKQQCEKTDTSLRELKNKFSNKDNIKEESLDIIVQPDLNISDIYGDDGYSDSGSGEEVVETKRKYKQDSFTCVYCQKVLRTKKGLKIHQRRHTGEKLRTCHICQAKFTRTNHLIRHMKIHNKGSAEMKHICVECGMGFDKMHSLMKHKKEHTLDNKGDTKMDITEVDIKTEPMKEDDSDSSKNGFVQEENNKTVRKNKRFECKFCNKVMTTSIGLSIHMRRHTGHNLANCEVSTLFYY